MRLLLDTHVFLWWITEDPRLSERATEIISDPANEVLFSVASGWEIVIKRGLGRIRFQESPRSLIPREVQRNGFRSVPVHLRHVLTVSDLPEIHNDPFDRLLVAQAIVEEAQFVSRDRSLSAYPVKVVW